MFFSRDCVELDEEIAGPLNTISEAERANRLFNYIHHHHTKLFRAIQSLEETCHTPLVLDPHLRLFLSTFTPIHYLSKVTPYADITRLLYAYYRDMGSADFLLEKRRWYDGARRQQNRLETTIEPFRKRIGHTVVLAFKGELNTTARKLIVKRIAKANQRARFINNLRKDSPRYLLKPFHHPMYGGMWLVVMEVDDVRFIESFCDKVTKGWLAIDKGAAVYTVPLWSPVPLAEALTYVAEFCRLSTILNCVPSDPYKGGIVCSL